MAMPDMVLPSSMPSRGIRYCTEYQGCAWMITVSVSRVTEKELTNMERVPMPMPQGPVKRRC